MEEKLRRGETLLLCFWIPFLPTLSLGDVTFFITKKESKIKKN